MARAAKKETPLTTEEKLAKALVPEEEQPYPVPENWCWVRLGDVIELISGRDVPISRCNNESIGIPYILGASNLENNAFSVERWIEKPEVVSQKGDILLSVKGTIGKVYIQREEYINISRQIMAIRPSSLLIKKFAYNFLVSICDELKLIGNGLIPGISRSDILEYAIPLPPLSEQQRIVTFIESLFGDMDAAKEKLQAVMDGFEERKAAILHEAFTGELTREWRKAHGLIFEDWKKYRYGELGESKLGKMLDKSKNVGIPVHYLRNVNVRWFDFDLSDLLIMQASKQEIESLRVKNGDLFICEGGEPGRCAIWCKGEQEIIFQKALHRFRPNEKVIGEYLCYYIYYLSLSDALARFFTGTTIKHLTGKSLCEISITVPTLPEQKEIVRMLDNIFAKESQSKAAVESVLSEIDTIKRSILATAFRGGFETNESTDASAKDALRRVL